MKVVAIYATESITFGKVLDATNRCLQDLLLAEPSEELNAKVHLPHTHTHILFDTILPTKVHRTTPHPHHTIPYPHPISPQAATQKGSSSMSIRRDWRSATPPRNSCLEKLVSILLYSGQVKMHIYINEFTLYQRMETLVNKYNCVKYHTRFRFALNENQNLE